MRSEMQTHATNPAALGDREIVNRIQGGEIALYDLLRSRYETILRVTARRYLRCDAEVDDVVQDTHRLALAHLDQFRGMCRHSLAAWLTRIAINRSIVAIRRRSRLEGWEDGAKAFEDQARLRRPAFADPEQQAANRELHRALERAVAALPETYRSAFVLREVEELSTAEVSEQLGISEACVKIRVHRARLRLRRRLGHWASPHTMTLPRKRPALCREVLN